MPLVLSRGHATSSPLAPPFASSISSNGRYLLDQFNNPFLIVGTSDSTITNISVSDMQSYMATRASQGFNFGQIAIIAGQTYNNATGTPDWATFDGIVPFLQSDGVTLGTGPANYDVTQPYLPFWLRIDAVFAAAQLNGITMFASILGDTVYHNYPTFYSTQGNTKLAAYATWFANRYKNYTYHHLWGYDHFTTISGGWAASDPYLGVMLNAVQVANPKCLHTLENNDGLWTVNTSNLDLTSDDTDFTFGPGNQMTINWMYDSRNNSPDTSRAYGLSTVMPVFFGEGVFDGDPPGKNTWSNLLNREYFYLPMVNGGCGSFYGSHTVWYFASGWQTSMSDAATTHIGVWKTFMQSIKWWTLVPDIVASFVTVGNTYSSGSVGTNGAVSADGHLGVVYLSANGSVTIAMTKMFGTTVARWFDPTSGMFTLIGSYSNTGTQTFTTSTNNAAGDPDWVLVLTA